MCELGLTSLCVAGKQDELCFTRLRGATENLRGSLESLQQSQEQSLNLSTLNHKCRQQDHFYTSLMSGEI